MQVEVVYKTVFGELNNLSPCPLPLQGKGEKEKRGGKAPSLKDSSHFPLRVRKNEGSPRGTKSLLYNHFPLSFEGEGD